MRAFQILLLLLASLSVAAVPDPFAGGLEHARPRGALFPVGSYGHTGYTGCFLWIDPATRTFYVFLSNRVYPDDKSNILPLYGELGTLAARAVKLKARATSN